MQYKSWTQFNGHLLQTIITQILYIFMFYHQMFICNCLCSIYVLPHNTKHVLIHPLNNKRITELYFVVEI